MNTYSRGVSILRPLFVVVLALAVVPRASAQTIDPSEVMFSWGAIHQASGQALAINFVVPDAPDVGDPTRIPVELLLQDRNGNIVYKQAAYVASGRAISFVIAADQRAAKTIAGDIFAFVDPNVRLLVVSLLVFRSPETGYLPAVQRMVPTLEVMDVQTGRVLDVANNPHAVVPDAPE